MSVWTLVAMAGVALAVLGWFGPLGARRWQRLPPSGATLVQPRLRWSFVLAGAVASMLVGWVFLPSGLTWLLPIFAVPCGFAGHHIGRRVPSARMREATRRRQRELPAALDLLSTCLQTGLPLPAATTAVRDALEGPLRDDLSGVLQRLDLGVPLREAWLGLAGTPQWRSLARDIARSSASGTGLVEVLQRASHDAREAQHAEHLSRARTAGVRSVLPLMICYLPAFLLVGIIPIVGSAVTRILG